METPKKPVKTKPKTKPKTKTIDTIQDFMKAYFPKDVIARRIDMTPFDYGAMLASNIFKQHDHILNK